MRATHDLLHIPLFLGLGIGLYFALPSEPTQALIWAAFGLSAITLCIALLMRKADKRMLALAALCISLAAFGFGRAEWRTHAVAAPVLSAPWNGYLEGRVLQVEPRARGMRITLDQLKMERIAPERTPAKARVTFTRDGMEVMSGDRVRFRAWLYAPSPPVLPGGFDLARYLWFSQIGAVGYTFVALEHVDETGSASEPSASLHIRQSASIQQLREHIARLAEKALPPRSAGIAQALLVGERGGISEEDHELLRKAGLSHLMAISGLHMGLIAGLIFLLTRRVLACSEWVALHVKLKKVAAIVSLIGVCGYLLLAGAPVSAQRATLMISLAMLAIFLERKTTPLRVGSIAAITVLVIAPEVLLSAGFQLSFAAVTGLVAFYQWERKRRYRKLAEQAEYEPVQRHSIKSAVGYPLGIALSSIVATLSTAPFAIYHFQLFSPYSVLANIVAIPLTAIVIMPLGLAALLAMPLGLEQPIVWMMGQGIDLLLMLVDAIGEWSFQGWIVPPLSTTALVACALAGLWLVAIKSALRWLAVPVIAIALATAGNYRVPDMMIERDYIAMRLHNTPEQWVLKGTRKGNWTTDVWQEMLGIDTWLSPNDPQVQGAVRCDEVGCVTQIQDHIVSIIYEGGGLAEECRLADTVVLTHYARLPKKALCAADTIDASYRRLEHEGAMALYAKEEGGVEVWTSSGSQGMRPWAWSVSRKQDRRSMK